MVPNDTLDLLTATPLYHHVQKFTVAFTVSYLLVHVTTFGQFEIIFIGTIDITIYAPVALYIADVPYPKDLLLNIYSRKSSN